MIGQTLGHYRIEEKVGAGGMGEVYRAQDLHLSRSVAIKVLPHGTLADEQARRRFRKEAEALSKLNHPNIQIVHDFNTQDGLDYLVSEFVPGPTLAEKLANGPLLEKEILGLGMQMAAALEEAHLQGVVHRDLKPGNIKVTPAGQLKVLDFGLAKQLSRVWEAAPTQSATETHTITGTLPYMAPEQLRDENVDHRSDIWAAGVVWYEMATGRRPFDARLSTALAADIQHKAITPPSQLNTGISARLEDLILKCLEKDPKNRYQSAKELYVDFTRLQRAMDSERSPSQPVPTLRARRGSVDSLAVLPFRNTSGDPETEYLSEGVTESIINILSQIPKVRVVPRSTVFRYRDPEMDPLWAGRDLNVRAVVVGRILHRADELVVKCELIDVANQAQLWGGQYSRRFEDIFSVEDQIAREICEKLRLQLTREVNKRMARRPTVNSEAYKLYLQGRHYWTKRTEEAMRKGLRCFQQAIEVDPAYSLAYVGLGDSYSMMGFYGALPPEEAFPKAKAAARKALEIDPRLPEAFASLAYAIFYYEWDWPVAEENFRRAIELSPNYPVARQWLGNALVAIGRTENGIAEITRALELDPLSSIINSAVGWVHMFARQYEAASAQFHKTLEMDPECMTAHLWLGQVWEHQGQLSEAISAGERAVAVSGRSPTCLASWGHSLALAGRTTEARDVLNELYETARSRYVSAHDFATLHLSLGEKDAALGMLDRAFRERAREMAMIGVEPRLDPLRSDPRFQDLLQRMNFPPH